MSAAPPGLGRVLARIEEIRSFDRAAPGFQSAYEAALIDAGSTTDDLGVSHARGPRWRPDTATAADALPPDAARWRGSIARAADAAGLDRNLMTAVVWSESDFVADAVSHAGAIGLAQLMPGTAEALGVDPYDPEQNLAGGARFLAEMLDRFGTPELALAAYNAGPTRLAEHLENPGATPLPTETDRYVEVVLGRYELLTGARP